MFSLCGESFSLSILIIFIDWLVCATNAKIVFQPTAFLRRNLPVCRSNCNDSCSPSSSPSGICLSVNNGTPEKWMTSLNTASNPAFYGFQSQEFTLYLRRSLEITFIWKSLWSFISYILKTIIYLLHYLIKKQKSWNLNHEEVMNRLQNSQLKMILMKHSNISFN